MTRNNIKLSCTAKRGLTEESFVSHFVPSWNLLTGKGETNKINDIPAYIRVA